MEYYNNDVIAAIASPHGKGAVAMLRLSGEGCFEIADKVFKAKSGLRASERAAREMYIGKFYSCGESVSLLDEGMCAVYKAPASYTGEDSAELFCHGGGAVTQSILESLLEAGARLAKGGEFTRRAFENGKMNLSAAEAVGEIIDAENPVYASLAARQLSGALGKRLRAVREELISSAAHYAACIDYADEGVEEPSGEETQRVILSARKELSLLAKGCLRGQYMRDGIPTALIGRTNSGKSSLMNRLLGYDRAIVSEYAGTTRDIINESLRLGNVVLKISDTAGLRDADNPVERIGIKRSIEAISASKLLLTLFDGSVPPSQEDMLTCEYVEKALEANPLIKAYKLINKADLSGQGVFYDYEDCCPSLPCFILSAATGEGLDRLTEEIEREFSFGADDYDTVTNLRAQDAINRAKRVIDETSEAMLAGFTADIIWSGLISAADILGELTGDNAAEDMIDKIFENYCVGK